MALCVYKWLRCLLCLAGVLSMLLCYHRGADAHDIQLLCVNVCLTMFSMCFLLFVDCPIKTNACLLALSESVEWLGLSS